MNLIKRFFSIVLILVVTAFVSEAQKTSTDSTGYPGDNFSLQGALQMFKKASSPEEFEKLLNTQSNNVNNLDLNKDGKIDYVKVIDRTEKKIHVFVLQVPVSEKESQDIAIMHLEKTGDTTAVIQIVGDKEVYGKEIIIEPDVEVKSSNSAGKWNNNSRGPSPGGDDEESTVVVVNVWYWPSVTFVYGIYYTPWVSPWRWGYYPGWWSTWRPVSWYTWYPRCTVYNTSFVAVNTYRVTGAQYIYAPYRTSAVSVTRQATVAVGSNGVVGGTKTTVTGPGGRTATRTTIVGGNRSGTKVGRATVVRVK
jgi:hypothetical protein